MGKSVSLWLDDDLLAMLTAFRRQNPKGSYGDWLHALAAKARRVQQLEQENARLKQAVRTTPATAPTRPVSHPDNSAAWYRTRDEIEEMQAKLDKFKDWVKDKGPEQVIALMWETITDDREFNYTPPGRQVLADLQKAQVIAQETRETIFATLSKIFGADT